MDRPYGLLAWSFFKIGLFGFGGGYAILPLIAHEVVETHRWATHGEFSDMLALSQMTPGPIAINAATYVGYTAGGLWGSVLATGLTCLAPFAIVVAASVFFMTAKNHPRVAGAMALLRPAVTGLVLAAALALFKPDNFRDEKAVVIFVSVFAASVWLKAHPLLLIFAAAAAGWALY